MKGRAHFALAGAVMTITATAAAHGAEVTPQHTAGRAVYEKWCAPCHDAGIDHPGTHALATKYQGVKSGVLLEWTDLPAALVRQTVRHGISIMPHFRKTEISDADLTALAAYLARNTPGGS